MFLFKKNSLTLNEIKEKPFKLEKDLQEIAENNLEKVFGLEFVCSEFAVWEFRIDTLAYDPENKSFVIIEYKRDRSFSIVDQWYSYLALLLNNKAEFVLKYNEEFKSPIQKSDINWESSKVIFVANGFTSYQKNAINFKDLPIELWESRQFENEIILFNQVKASKTSESIKTISKWDKTFSKITEEIKTYTIEDHFKEWWNESKEIYENFKNKVLELDSRIEEDPKKWYIAYKVGNKVLIELYVYKSKLNIDFMKIEPKDLKDPEKKVFYKKNSIKHFKRHISTFSINNEDDIDYWIMLIKQVLKKFFL